MTADVIRLIAGGLIALVCCYVGVLIKRHYAEREKFFAEAEEFASALASELGFRKTPVPVFISRFREGRKGGFPDALGRFATGLALGKDRSEAAECALDGAGLGREEKKQMKDFFSALGSTTLSDQLSAAAHWRETFAGERAKRAADTKRLGGMYFKLAVLLGIAVLIALA